MELEVLKEAIVSVLKVYPGEITGETTFLGDLGADSLDVYQIVLYVEDALNISLEVEEIKEPGGIGPDFVETPHIYVDYLVKKEA